MTEWTPKETDIEKSDGPSAKPGKPWALLGSFVVGLVAVALLVMIVRVFQDDDKPKHARQDYYIEAREAGFAVGYVSREDYREAMAAHDRNDIAGFVKVTRSGRGLYVKDRTFVKPLDDMRGEITEVRVLSGEYKGRTLFLPPTYVK